MAKAGDGQELFYQKLEFKRVVEFFIALSVRGTNLSRGCERLLSVGA